jgi:hypothetical protein
MTQPSVTRPAGTTEPGDPSSATYRPGICNIGPAEIARRRRAGHVGLAATVGLLAALVAVDAPPLARFSIALPAAGAASGYLQARLHFCAGFGSRGEYNFGPLGHIEQVADAEARRRDRQASTRIALASLAIGLAAGAVAATVAR